MSQHWTSAEKNMGIAFRDRISGDRSSNINEAIKCYKRALQICTQESTTQEWANEQLNMEFAYLGRVNVKEPVIFQVQDLLLKIFSSTNPRNGQPNFLKGCSLNTNLCLGSGSLSDVIKSCEQGPHALEYTKSLSSTGLSFSTHLDEEQDNVHHTVIGY